MSNTVLGSDPSGRVRGLLVAAVLVVAAPGGMALAADEVESKIDAARIKSRAGKLDEALDIVDEIAGSHAKDPRVHYYRAVFLQKLERLNEAADAIEQATATIGAYKTAQSNTPPAIELENSIEEIADELLEYRRKARDVLAEYVATSLKVAWALLDEKKGVWAHFVELQLGLTGEANEAFLGRLRDAVTDDVRKEYTRHVNALPRGKGGAVDEEAEKVLEKNVDEASRSVQRKKYDEARLFAMAALETDPGHLEALVCLSEALEGLGRLEEATLAALRAIDAPKGKDRSATSLYRRATKQIKDCEPGLVDFIEARERAAKELASLHTRASRSKRAFDRQWIAGLAVLVAPGDLALRDVIAEAGGAGPAAGFVALTRPGVEWEWRHKGSGTGLTRGELLFTPNDGPYMTQALPQDHALGKDFVLRFRMSYDMESGSDHAIFLTFRENDRDSGSSLILIPESKHHVGFGRRDGDGGWRITEVYPCPKDAPVRNRWHEVEVAWSDASKRLVMTVDRKPTFDYKLRDADSLDGTWSFGFGGGKALRIRDVYLRTSE